MHDIDRTALEYEPDLEQYDYKDEMESDYEGEDEYGYEAESDYESDYEDYEDDENVFSEEEEMDLAAELLSTADEAELDAFLGNLVRKAGRKIRQIAKSPVAQVLKQNLKKVAKTALPMLGRAAGTAIGGPLGGKIGSRLAAGAGRAFGLELEGMVPEDQEFEVARRVVRLAGNATKQAARCPPNAAPTQAAQTALVAAAHKDAPGLVRPSRPPVKKPMRPTPKPMVADRSGRWLRRGNRIVLLGV